MTVTRFRTSFVEFVPREREEGVLYVSIAYGTAVHSCACGCGNKVVTPITPAGWKITWDGEESTLSPSIGSWGFPCRSHYLIIGGRVRWAADWNDRQILAGRERDRRARDRHFGRDAEASSEL